MEKKINEPAIKLLRRSTDLGILIASKLQLIQGYLRHYDPVSKKPLFLGGLEVDSRERKIKPWK